MKGIRLTTILGSLCIFTLVFVLGSSDVSSSHSYGYDSFNHNNLIDDIRFRDSGSMEVPDIQSFLNSVGGELASKSFDGKSAASIINKAADSYGINPRVIISTLQKEQSLITDPSPHSSQYNFAMGYGCPDGPGCSGEYSGFPKQVDNGTWQLRLNFERAGGNNSWWNPNISYACPGPTRYYNKGLYPGNSVGFKNENGSIYRNVTIANAATASLYCYTPHAYSPYYSGSYNFVVSWEHWFGSTKGPLLFTVNNGGTVHLGWGGYYYPIPSPAILNAWGLNGYPVGHRTTTQLSSLTKGPMLRLLARFDTDRIYLLDSARKHHFPSREVFESYHSFGEETNYHSTLGLMVREGQRMETILRASGSNPVYFVENKKKRWIVDRDTFTTMGDPTYASRSSVVLSPTYVNALSKGAPILQDSKIIHVQSTNTRYFFDGVYRHNLPNSVAEVWSLSIDYNGISAEEVNQLPGGTTMSPLLKNSAGTKYIASKGKKHLLEGSNAQAWGLLDSDFVSLTNGGLARFADANASTLVRVGPNGTTVYLVRNTDLLPIPTRFDFEKSSFDWSEIMPIDQVTADKLGIGQTHVYGPGALVRINNEPVYLIDSGFSRTHIPSRAIFDHFGFSWNNIRDITAASLVGYADKPVLSVIVQNNSGKWLVDQGKRYIFSDTLYGASYYNFGSRSVSTLPPSILSLVPQSTKPLSELIRGTADTVYIVEDGVKRAFLTRESFENYGGEWDKIVDLSDNFTDSIPAGEPMP